MMNQSMLRFTAYVACWMLAGMAASLWAQCNPQPNGCSPAPGMYCLSNAFDVATVGVNYSRHSQFFHSGWKILPGDAVAYIRKIRVDSITGLPQGLVLTIRSLNPDDGPAGVVYQGFNGPVDRFLSRVGTPAEGFGACFAVTGNPSHATYVYDSVRVHVTPFYAGLDEGEGIPDFTGTIAPRVYAFKMPVVFSSDGEFYFGLETTSTEYCTGTLLQLAAFADPPYGVNFRWEPAAYTDNPEVAQPIVFPPTTTVFTVTAYNEILEYTATVTVYVNESPYVNLGPDLVIEEGETITLDAGPYGMHYEWNTGESGRFLMVNVPGTYAVEVIAANGCSSYDTIHVFAAGGFYIEPPGAVHLVCGTSTTLTLSLVPPDAPVSVSWNPSHGVSPPNALSVTLSPTQTTTYTVTATDGVSSFQTQVQVNVRSPLELGPHRTFLPGGGVILDAGPALSYRWNTGEITRTVMADEAGWYWVETQYEGCPPGRDTVHVAVNGHTVSGRVFKDVNINSSYETGEPGFDEIVVWAVSGERKYYASTREDGYYELYLPDGNWYVTCRYPDYYAQSTPFSGGYSFSFWGENQNVPGTNFGFGEIPVPFSDLRVWMFRRAPAPDFPAQNPSPFVIVYQNAGNHVQSGRVELYLDTRTAFFYASPYPDALQPLRWEFDNLAPGEKRRIHVQISGESDLERYTHRVEVRGLGQDQTPWNNVTHCEYSTNPQEYGQELTRRISGADSVSVGLAFLHQSTSPKLNVMLRDTLEGVIPPESIWAWVSTHDGRFRVKGRGVVEWRWMNVLLPPWGAEAGTGLGAVHYNAVAAPGQICSVPYLAAAQATFDELTAHESTHIPDYFNPAPTYEIVLSDTVVVNEPALFEATVLQGADATWNFGANAVPQAVAGPGPHTVRFTSLGPQRIVFSLRRGVCQLDDFYDVFVADTPGDTVPDTSLRVAKQNVQPVVVYPNPVGDKFFIRHAGKAVRWELFDALGKKVGEGTSNGQPIPAPPPGLYGLRIESRTFRLSVVGQ